MSVVEYMHLYSDAEGESHFQSRQVEFIATLPLRLPNQVRFVASLQLFDNATQRTVAALPAVQ